MCTAEIADTTLHTGQGMHGSFSRADTRNFMAAIGPDFKAKFADTAPVGNADVAPTLAHVLGVTLGGPGTLEGRVISEAFKGGKLPKVTARHIRIAQGGKRGADHSRSTGGWFYALFRRGGHSGTHGRAFLPLNIRRAKRESAITLQ